MAKSDLNIPPKKFNNLIIDGLLSNFLHICIMLMIINGKKLVPIFGSIDKLILKYLKK